MMIAPLLALTLAALAPPEISANVKDGDVISKETSFRVTVKSSSPVTQVEFYVGDELRDNDTSTPYEFKIDPLNEKEGDLNITFAAYNTDGDSGRKSFKIKIDTGASRGIAALIQEGNAHLVEQRWDQAIVSGRAALKIDPENNQARLIMARAFFGKGVLDQAQQYAEDAVAKDSKFTEAIQLLSAINLQKAFRTLNTGGDKNETIKIIGSALKSSVEAEKKVLEMRMDSFGPVKDENRLTYTDLAFRLGRYSTVIGTLQPLLASNPQNSAFGNRVALAQVRSGRWQDAYVTLNDMKRRGALDGYSYALLAIVEEQAGRTTASDDAMAEAIGNDPSSVPVQLGQVYVALRRGRTNVMGQLASNLLKQEGTLPEASYYLSTMYTILGQYRESDQYFERAVLANPMMYDMYLERGSQALVPVARRQITDTEARNYQFEVANAFYQAALTAKPDSAEALTAVALYHILRGNMDDAVRFARAAIQAAPGYIAGQYTGSLIFTSAGEAYRASADQIRRNAAGSLTDDQRKQINDLNNLSRTLLDEAQRARTASTTGDRARLEGRSIPNIGDAFTYFYIHGRQPLLTLP